MIIYILGRFYLPIFLFSYKYKKILQEKFYTIIYKIILNVKIQKLNNKKIWLIAKNILYLYELNY